MLKPSSFEQEPFGAMPTQKETVYGVLRKHTPFKQKTTAFNLAGCRSPSKVKLFSGLVGFIPFKGKGIFVPKSKANTKRVKHMVRHA